MKQYYITFRSVTFAQRGEQVLNRKGIRCVLQRTPRWMEEKGCGYSLVLRTRDAVPAVDALRQDGVQIGKIYAQRPDGVLEEITV